MNSLCSELTSEWSDDDHVSERHSVRRALIPGFSLLLAVFGIAFFGSHSKISGPRGPALDKWPETTRLPRDVNRPTLVVFLHPHCPCSSATFSELESILNEHQFVQTFVVFIRPEANEPTWVRGATWNRANAMKRVIVHVDTGGVEAQRFGAVTSGHVCLYSTDGGMRFSGGITPSRGRKGMNLGRITIDTFLSFGRSHTTTTAPVYGCPLLAI